MSRTGKVIEDPFRKNQPLLAFSGALSTDARLHTMPKMIRAAFWPEEKKIGCVAIQRSFNCDPAIARIFPADLVTMRILNSPVYIFEATETQWQAMARDWSLVDPKARSRPAMAHLH